MWGATYSHGGGPSSDARRSPYSDLPERNPPVTNVNMRPGYRIRGVIRQRRQLPGTTARRAQSRGGRPSVAGRRVLAGVALEGHRPDDDAPALVGVGSEDLDVVGAQLRRPVAELGERGLL